MGFFLSLYSTVVDRTYISAGLAALHYLNTSPDTQLSYTCTTTKIESTTVYTKITSVVSTPPVSPTTQIFMAHLNSFAVMRNYIACACVGAHLLGITRVGDTASCVWLIVFTSNCCVGSSGPMVVHVLDCRRGFEHLTGCKWRHARYIRCRLQRCCLQCVIHALPISHGKGGLDSIT